jgi:MFS family permease
VPAPSDAVAAPTGNDFTLSARSRKIGAVRDRLLRMIGPTPLVRSLAGQSVLSAFGEGAFLTGSAVFFTIIVGLSAQQVGLGLSVAALARFVMSVPLGRMADRVGAKRMWQVTSAV